MAFAIIMYNYAILKQLKDTENNVGYTRSPLVHHQ